MRPDLANLLAALREDPADEVANLALADWCQEQPDAATQARGEHVRLSLQRSKLHPNTKVARQLMTQLKALEKQHRPAWLGQLRRIAERSEFLPGGLVRLQIEEEKLGKARAADVAAPSAEAFAWVSEVHLRPGPAEDFAWLADRLPGGFVRSFTYAGFHAATPGPAAAAALGRCRWLPGLRSLHWSTHPLEDAGAVALASFEALNHLRELALTNPSLTHAGIAALASSPHLAGLERFFFQNNSLDHQACAALSSATFASSLRTLMIASCRIDAAGLRALLTPSFGPNLQTLIMHTNGLDAAAREVLASWPNRAGIRDLRVA
jgi:uncharacterized protein (TIGR02996 family)